MYNQCVRFNYNDRVRKNMGIVMVGRVIHPISPASYTDGSYRRPESREKPVYVKWADGSQGWIHSVYLERIYG